VVTRLKLSKILFEALFEKLTVIIVHTVESVAGIGRLSMERSIPCVRVTQPVIISNDNNKSSPKSFGKSPVATSQAVNGLARCVC